MIGWGGWSSSVDPAPSLCKQMHRKHLVKKQLL